jgi:hypothetical protein
MIPEYNYEAFVAEVESEHAEKDAEWTDPLKAQWIT